MSTLPSTPLPAGQEPGEPKRFRLVRSDSRDIEFTGHLVGLAQREGEPGRMERALTVAVYVTAGGKIITHVERGGLVADPLPARGTRERVRVHGVPAGGARGPDQIELRGAEARGAVHESPEAAFAWLVADNGGKLGPVSKAAWEEACRRWPALAVHEVEHVG